MTNPYQPPTTAGADVKYGGRPLWLWIECVCSIAASLFSLVLFHFYCHWHWYTFKTGQPWQESLPGQLGLSWILAVDGLKVVQIVIAIISVAITLDLLYHRKAYLQGAVTVPTSLVAAGLALTAT